MIRSSIVIHAYCIVPADVLHCRSKLDGKQIPIDTYKEFVAEVIKSEDDKEISRNKTQVSQVEIAVIK